MLIEYLEARLREEAVSPELSEVFYRLLYELRYDKLLFDEYSKIDLSILQPTPKATPSPATQPSWWETAVVALVVRVSHQRLAATAD